VYRDAANRTVLRTVHNAAGAVRCCNIWLSVTGLQSAAGYRLSVAVLGSHCSVGLRVRL